MSASVSLAYPLGFPSFVTCTSGLNSLIIFTTSLTDILVPVPTLNISFFTRDSIDAIQAFATSVTCI